MPLMAPAVIFLALFFLVPLGYVVWMSLSQPVIGLQNFGRLLNSSLFASVLYNTFKTALLVTLLSLLFAYPLAYAAANGSKRFATFLLTVVALSFWTSYLVRTYAWMVILGNQGPVTALLSWFGWDPTPKILFTTFSATLAMTHALIPFMTMSLFAVMKRIDPLYVRAAENLGAHPFRAFVSVYLPLSAPGIVNGCTLVFITCLGFYVMPVLLGSPRDQMIAGIIGDQIEQTLDFGLGSAISIVLLALTLAVYALYNRFFGLDRLWAGGDR
ncbi:ABC transporter permease subunit [Sinorhizobium meliloti]|nr:ABC transporter permease subunit [Sinorhizobium meliloti]MDW9649156.1 ABC transporter permease subunit [Sinorhizobium meliloti]